jgi:multimeric flavodoxin WrbA
MVVTRENKKNPLIILGSLRSDGNTLRAIKMAIKDRSIPIVDLQTLNIAHYDYDYANSQDDFLPLAEKMVRHNPIILATPVYWYSMSALMKTFIDRWSDLLDIRKDIGRRLAHKELYVIASYGESIPQGFEAAFSQTCDYLDMQYKGCFYFYGGSDPELVKNNECIANRCFSEVFN